MPVRRGQLLRELWVPLARSTRWAPLAASAVVAWVVVHLMAKDPYAVTGERITAARVGALVIALGAAFVLDDPTQSTTAHLPTSLLLRRVGRIALSLPVVALAWLAVCFLATRTSGEPEPFPAGDLRVEMASLTALALAISAAAARFVTEGLGGIAGGPILLGLVAVSFFLPQELWLFPGEASDARWPGAHEVWRVVLGGAVAALVLASRDPGRGRLLRRRPHGDQPRRREPARKATAAFQAATTPVRR